MNKYLDPASQYEIHQKALEYKADSSQYFLWVWESFEVIVDEIRFLVEFDGHVIRTGENGEMSISDDSRFKSISVFMEKHEYPFKIDKDDLSKNHSITEDRIIKAVDLEVLEYARKSDKWEIE